MAQEIVFEILAPEQFGLVKPLWRKLNEMHRRKSRDFREHYAAFTFEERLKSLTGKRAHLELAKDPGNAAVVGYCLSSLDADRCGEVESVFVEEDYRGRGIGAELLKRAVAWLNENGAKKKQVSVAAGNESVVGFYRNLGFRPRRIVLEERTPREKHRGGCGTP